MLTARSDNGANPSSTGSLTTSARAAIVALVPRPKVSWRLEAGTSAGPVLRRPTHAEPIASGRMPQAFEMRTRSLLPPILTRGIIRSVWLLKAAPSAGAGAAVQVPTQCVSSLMAFDASCSLLSTARPRLHPPGLFRRMRPGLQVVGGHVVRQNRIAGDQICHGHGSTRNE